MNLRKAKKKIKHNTIINLWFNSFIDNSKALINFKELYNKDNIDNETKNLYLTSAKITLYYMEFDLSNGYKIAHKLNISKKQYIKVLYNHLITISV